MIDIEDVKRLTLGPDDVLVVQAQRPITQVQREYLASLVEKGLPTLRGRIFVTDRDIDLMVLSKSDVPDAA